MTKIKDPIQYLKTRAKEEAAAAEHGDIAALPNDSPAEKQRKFDAGRSHRREAERLAAMVPGALASVAAKAASSRDAAKVKAVGPAVETPSVPDRAQPAATNNT